MPPDDLKRSLQTWVLEGFLNGSLPLELNRQFKEQLATDPALEQRLLAHWLLQTYADHERDTRELYEDLDALTLQLLRQPKKRNTGLVIQFLPRLLSPKLLMRAAAVAGLLLGTWAVIRPNELLTRRFENIDLTSLDPDGLGFGGVIQPVVRLNRIPGWRGWLWRSNQYAWPNDTLYIYDEAIQKLPADSLELIELDKTGNQYLLRAGKRNLRVDKGQTKPTSLD